MSGDQQPALPPKSGAPATPVVSRTRWPLYGCGVLVALLLIIVATVAITLWWIQRPIKPVVLSQQEKNTVEQKLRAVEEARANEPAFTNRTTLPDPGADTPMPRQLEDARYVPGTKVLRLTEREINGLLNANTDLGRSVRLEFGRDAINAYLVVPIPQDFPIGGGKMFRARGRFRVALGGEGKPYAMLEDVTVFGLSLPKAWLGGLKGENLLETAMGERRTGTTLKGIRSLRIQPGELVLEVED